MKKIFAVTLSLILSGCGASIYRPKPAVPTAVFSVPYLADLSSPNLFKDYDALPEGPLKVARRNAILWEYIWLTDQTYGNYETSFFAGQAFIATGADFLNIALSATAAVTGTAHLKSILAVASGSVTGMRASYEKNFYDLATREAIVQVMRSARLEQLATIEAGMATCSTSTPCGTNMASYSLEQGLLDVGDYFDRGTILGALMTIAHSSSQQAGAARLAMKTIRKN
jgi:hypothetical protein